MASLDVDSFLTFTIAIIVFFVGVDLNRRIGFLRDHNIPEPVTGGLLAALVVALIHSLGRIEIGFELEMRDRLLVYFFTCIGLNARFSDLLKGGRPLLTLLILTLAFIGVQNAVGIAGAKMVGSNPVVGIVAGSVSLIGGHGTAIAWAPEMEKAGVANAMEMGIASATLGLIVASLIGGPIAKFLLLRHQLEGEPLDQSIVGISFEKEESEKINHLSIMGVLLTMHLAIIFGYLLHTMSLRAGFTLPLYVPCLLAAILLSNTVPMALPKMRWPARTKALALVSDFSLVQCHHLDFG